MKKSELKALINECIHEVLAEDNNIKKQEAIKEIKRIIAENDLNEEDLEEIDIKQGLKNIATRFLNKAAEKIPGEYKEYYNNFKTLVQQDVDLMSKIENAVNNTPEGEKLKAAVEKEGGAEEAKTDLINTIPQAIGKAETLKEGITGKIFNKLGSVSAKVWGTLAGAAATAAWQLIVKVPGLIERLDTIGEEAARMSKTASEVPVGIQLLFGGLAVASVMFAVAAVSKSKKVG